MARQRIRFLLVCGREGCGRESYNEFCSPSCYNQSHQVKVGGPRRSARLRHEVIGKAVLPWKYKGPAVPIDHDQLMASSLQGMVPPLRHLLKTRRIIEHPCPECRRELAFETFECWRQGAWHEIKIEKCSTLNTLRHISLGLERCRYYRELEVRLLPDRPPPQ